MDPSIGVTRDRPQLMTLPQEVKDMIFEFAFASSADVTHVTRHDWEAKESQKRFCDTHYVPRPFPGPKVEQFFVSKEYFVHAAKVYVRAQTFGGLLKDSVFVTAEGIVQAYTRKIEADINYWYTLSQMPNPISLTVGINFDSMRMHGKHPYLDLLDDGDFEESLNISQLIKMRGLRELKAKEFLWEELKDPDQSDMRRRNFERLERFIRSHVTQPKESVGADLKPYPSASLYTGSRVRLQGCRLLSTIEMLGLVMPYSVSDKRAIQPLGDPAPEDIASVGERWKLDDEDIPETVNGFLSLLSARGSDVMKWVADAKKARASRKARKARKAAKWEASKNKEAEKRVGKVARRLEMVASKVRKAKKPKKKPKAEGKL